MDIPASLLGLVAYAYFFWVLPLAAPVFMLNLTPQLPEALQPYLPYSVDNNAKLYDDLQSRLLVDVTLLALFAVPHSIFARPAAKEAFGFLGKLYRTAYVLKSAASLHLLLHFWQPLDGTEIWTLPTALCLVVFALGWVWLVSSTFAIDHLELFGLKQASGVDVMQSLGLAPGDGLCERAHYGVVRHPIMLGFFVMFFAVPSMTITHLFFSVACSTYCLLAVALLEEPDLAAAMPEAYPAYRTRVPMYCPFLGGSGAGKAEGAAKAE